MLLLYSGSVEKEAIPSTVLLHLRNGTSMDNYKGYLYIVGYY